MKRSLSFFVPGIPAPGGSKRSFIPCKKGENPWQAVKRGARPILTDMGGQANKNWRASVALAGHHAMNDMVTRTGQPLFDGPLSFTVTFVMPRLKGHYNSRGELKPNAPVFVTTRPDVLKLGRSTEDALTGVVWRDDSIVAVEHLYRIYGDETGAHIKIESLNDVVAEYVKIQSAQQDLAFIL